MSTSPFPYTLPPAPDACLVLFNWLLWSVLPSALLVPAWSHVWKPRRRWSCQAGEMLLLCDWGTSPVFQVNVKSTCMMYDWGAMLCNVLSHLVHAPCCQSPNALLTCGIIHNTQKITQHIFLTFHYFIEKLRLQWSPHCARSSEAWVNNHVIVMESLTLLTLVGVQVSVSVNIFIIQFLTTDLH